MKRIETTEWYSTKRIKSYGMNINLIFGQRGNGKTYSIKQEILDILKTGKTFVYVRRMHRMITRRKAEKLFNDMSDIIFKEFGDYIYYDGQGSYYLGDDKNRKYVGCATAIEDAYIDKGYPSDAGIIFFDEFIDYKYFENEITMFLHTLKNYIRTPEQEKNCKVYMCANTILKHCPYFDYFGINIQKMSQGEIAIVYGQNGGKAAAEWCKPKVKELGVEETSEIFGFGGGASDMILKGVWEYNNCNTLNVDGIGWNSQRKRVKAYITGLCNVYEMSYCINNGNPIAFIRRINTQDGKVAGGIKYNFSFDNSLILTNKYGIVPRYNRMSKFVNDGIRKEIDLIKECIHVGRVVYQNHEVGTEFNVALESF